MNQYQIFLQNGKALNIGSEEDKLFGELFKLMNSPNIRFIAFNPRIIHKNMINCVVPMQREGVDPNVTISLQNGVEISAYDNEFDASKTSIDLNNFNISFVKIGDVIINRDLVQYVSPISQ